MGEVLHIEDALNEKGVYVSTTSGVSMYPMLRNRRDTIIVKPPTAPLKKYDVPLYRRGDDYVLHRIIGKDDKGYIICGDNCINKEYGITENQIIGVLVGFYREENSDNKKCFDNCVAGKEDLKLSDNDSVYEITISEDDIIREQGTMLEDEGQSGFAPEYLETLALLRKVAEVLPEKDGFLMHGAVIQWKDKAYMFTAPSGTGKTTHIRLWRKYLGQGVSIINGDKPFIRIVDDCVRIYGTPWAGKEGWQNNKNAPLGGICIIERGTECGIRKLDSKEAIPYLLGQIHFGDSSAQAGKTLELLDVLIKKVPVYILNCDISEHAVRTSYEAMTGEKYRES